jgi:hypothetical protein
MGAGVAQEGMVLAAGVIDMEAPAVQGLGVGQRSITAAA